MVDGPALGTRLLIEVSMERRNKVIACILLVVGAASLVIGAQHSRTVYKKEALEYGIDLFDSVSEFELVEDATFSGVEQVDGKLYSTYDRSAGKTKRACPT